jgi:hypothetical protein
VQVSRGLDYAIAERNVAITTKGNTTTISLEPLRLPAQYGHFASADLHVHMNYGGHYHNTPQNLIEQARAEHSGCRLQPDRQQGRARSGRRAVHDQAVA